MEYKYTGIILSKRDIGETDRIYDVYTAECGKISAIARGVRKSKSKLAGHLENFCLVDLTVMKNRGMGNISGSIIEEGFVSLRNDLESLKIVFSALRVFSCLIVSEEKDVRIFNLLLEYLEAMNEGASNRSALINAKKNTVTQGFIFKLLDLSGYKMEIGKCVKCQSKLYSKDNFFSYSFGGVICKNCADKEKNIISLSDNAIKTMRIFSQNDLKPLFKLSVDEKYIKEIERLLQGFVKWVL